MVSTAEVVTICCASSAEILRTARHVMPQDGVKSSNWCSLAREWVVFQVRLRARRIIEQNADEKFILSLLTLHGLTRRILYGLSDRTLILFSSAFSSCLVSVAISFMILIEPRPNVSNAMLNPMMHAAEKTVGNLHDPFKRYGQHRKEKVERSKLAPCGDLAEGPD